ncbi:sensor histidine kinase [Hydrogenophaga crassostreae]|uniref:sensor histidine kinase n=1 Tax=Hydrogenophaga crassostreae TaxID=1763535 RepID=UPI0018D32399|nr:sensor histidine kinase [Hydrogenophaga crassostreae]
MSTAGPDIVLLNSNWRSAVVLLFTVAALTMLWGLNQRSQDELRTQVLARAAHSSVQLADAMAGQVGAELALMDHALLDLRETLPDGQSDDHGLHKNTLDFLPDGLVSYLSLVSADGLVTYNSRGVGVGLDIGDRTHFLALQSGPDHLVIGAPVRANFDGEWLIPLGRPLYRNGQFAGAIYLLVSSERMGQRMGRLALDKEDVLVLANANGKLLARSVDYGAAMGKSVPPDRPFMQEGAAASGSYWQNSAVDQLPRVFGWHRLPGSGALIVVGLSESSVLAPVVDASNRSRWLTGTLSAVLLLGGLAVTWLLWRDGRSARAMHESEQLLKGAQGMAKLGHWSLDMRTGVNVWSEELHRIFGNAPDAHGLSVEAFLERVHPDDRQRLVAAMGEAAQAFGAMDIVHRIVMGDGRVKHVRAQCVFEGENGVAVRNRGAVQDITEVRVAQLALKEMNEKLEVRVEERTRELAALNNELEAFSYSVSHDLRTPLRSIHGFASLLEEESDKLSPDGRAHLRRIQDAARRMGLLISDLLTMAHQSRAVVNLQWVSLSELAQAVAQDVEREDPQRKVVWSIEPALWAWADPVLMRVVLQNLLGNAWKYSGQAAQAEISFEKVGQAHGMTEFCVRDNGAGFDMAFVDQLFQPFKRLHAHHEFEGTGVGLASVHRLVQRHGGTVRAEGKVGQGAAIYFTLPDAPDALAEQDVSQQG